jgi:hypothetical protein
MLAEAPAPALFNRKDLPHTCTTLEAARFGHHRKLRGGPTRRSEPSPRPRFQSRRQARPRVLVVLDRDEACPCSSLKGSIVSRRGLAIAKAVVLQLDSSAAAEEGEGPGKRKAPPGRGFTRGERRDLNPRPPGPQPGALPAELRPPRIGIDAISGSRARAAPLRGVPPSPLSSSGPAARRHARRRSRSRAARSSP